ncbi:MAG: PD-(D/E)XK nuclease family protein [Crocinitomicaceae bacterium]|nr:PD-(D/E)XK nuclease family protein [Crocinitomicaceae bacterium]
MNEGNLPPTNPIQTMIPMDLRKYHGLPAPREKQGIFAHHFYRLLHHCEELHVTYCSADESIGSNEPSRYLMQLEMELSRINPNVSIQKKIYALDATKEQMLKEINKTPEIISRLDELFAASTSASMLKKYLTCPLDFYFRYVMDFGEADNVEEEIEHSTFGTFIHNTLEELYLPFARYSADGELQSPPPKNITSLDIEQMLKNYKVVLYNQFMKHFNSDKEAFMKGKNLLSYQMAMELTERFLKSEIKFLAQQSEPVFIEALEREYAAEIEIDVHGTPKKVKLRGFIDRIDSIGDRIRIVDYKSGKVNPSDVALRNSDQTAELIVESIANKKHVLQLMLYAFLYYTNEHKIAEPNIISFVSANNEPFSLDTKKQTLQEIIEAFPDYIARILEDIYEEDTSFQHQVKGQYSYCQYCE